MTSSDASTGWESGDSTATDTPASQRWGAEHAMTPFEALDLLLTWAIDGSAADHVDAEQWATVIAGQLREVESVRETLAVCTDQTAEIDRLNAGRELEQHMLRSAVDQIKAALNIHYLNPGQNLGHPECGYCRGADEEPLEWPCPTARALGITDV